MRAAAVAQPQAQHRFKQLIREWPGIDHRHIQRGAEMGMRLMHCGGSKQDNFGAILCYGAFCLGLKQRKYRVFFAVEQTKVIRSQINRPNLRTGRGHAKIG